MLVPPAFCTEEGVMLYPWYLFVFHRDAVFACFVGTGFDLREMGRWENVITTTVIIRR